MKKLVRPSTENTPRDTMDYEIVDQRQRPWGYEVRAKVLKNGKVKGTIEVLFPKKPSVKFLKKRCDKKVKQFELGINLPEEMEKLWTADEVTYILRQNGYLTATEEFSEDMEPKTDSPVYTAEEVTDMLREKNYMDETEEFGPYMPYKITEEVL